MDSTPAVHAFVVVGSDSAQRRANLCNADPLVREAVVGVLEEIRDARSIDDLVTALGDSVLSVRAKAAWALGRMRAKEASF